MTVSEIRILVAADQRNVRGNLKMILEAAGYRVDATGDSEEAVARCHRADYDIIFIDIHMPKIEGLDLVRCIRELNGKSTVVTLSQYGAITKVVESMKLGAVDFVEKPLDTRKVQLLCDEILRRHALMNNDTVSELLQLAELALEQKSFVEARIYLKMAMLRDENRAEPCFWLSELYESQGDVREALHYFCRALDAAPSFQPTRKSLFHLKQLATGNVAGNNKLSA